MLNPQTSIIRSDRNAAEILAEIGRQTFIESHGHSASSADIAAYVNEKYTADVFRQELENTGHLYHTIYYGQQAAGYSKIIMNCGHENIAFSNITKLERLYLLKDYYDLKLGLQLMEYNIRLSKENNQKGIWLFVWKENDRALRFYQKYGFQIVGSHDFRISVHHSNPNHQMLLLY